MKNTIITVLVTLTLLFSLVIPVLGNCNYELIKTTSIPGKEKVIIIDEENDVIRSRFSEEDSIVVSNKPNVDIKKIIYEQDDQLITIKLFVKGIIENRGNLEDVMHPSDYTMDFVYYALFIDTLLDNYQIIYVNNECNISCSNRNITIAANSCYTTDNKLEISFELKDQDDTCELISACSGDWKINGFTGIICSDFTEEPGIPIELNKKVKVDDIWENEIEAELDETVRFKIAITYHDVDRNGDGYVLNNITIRDELPEGLIYAGNVVLIVEGIQVYDYEEYVSENNRIITWNIKYKDLWLNLWDGQSASLEFDAKITDYGLYVNKVNITAFEWCVHVWRYAEATANVNVQPPIDFRSRDVDDDGNLEFAYDSNMTSSDGFENYVDYDSSSKAIISKDGDDDGKIDHFIDINNDSVPDRYWDPDDDILVDIIIDDVDIDGTDEWIFDSNNDSIDDSYYDPDDNQIHPYITFTLNISIVGKGIVIENPYKAKYLKGTSVKLKAFADKNWSFIHWSGDISGNNSYMNIIMDSNKTITAHFIRIIPWDTTPPKVNITKPKNNTLYKNNKEIKSILLKTRIIGPINIEVNAFDEGSGVDKVEFYINNKLKSTDTSEPYSWNWNETHWLPRLFTIKVIAYDKAGNNNSDTITVRKMGDFNFFRNNKNLSSLLIGGSIVLIGGSIGLKILNKLFGDSGEGDGTPGDEETKDNEPVADAGGPYSGNVGQTISFDGSGSNDSEGAIVSYSWTFGDGASDAGVSPTHIYQKEGEYTVTLTVTDSSGSSTTSETTVTIAPPESSKEESGNDNIFWYVVSGLATCLLASLGVLYFRRKFYV